MKAQEHEDEAFRLLSESDRLYSLRVHQPAQNAQATELSTRALAHFEAAKVRRREERVQGELELIKKLSDIGVFDTL